MNTFAKVTVALTLAGRTWAGPVELMENGGFEDVKDGTPVGCSVQHPFATLASSPEARSGNTAAWFRLPKPSDCSWFYTGKAGVKTGALYRGVLWARGEGDIDVLLPQYAGGLFLESRSVGFADGALTDEWKRYEFTYRTDDPRVGSIAVAVRLQNGTSLLVDDVSFTFDPADNPGVSLDEPVLTKPLRMRLETRDAEAAVYFNGARVDFTNGVGEVTLEEGLGTLAIEARATGEAPGIRVRFPGHPEADGRWRVSTNAAAGWQATGFDDSSGGWRLALSQPDGFQWNWNLGADRSYFRQTLLWNATHYGPNFCVHPRVKTWGFAQESLETLWLALYSPLPFPLTNYEFTLDVPAEFGLLDMLNVIPAFSGNRDNTRPLRVLSEEMLRGELPYRRYRIFYAGEAVTPTATACSLLPIRMTRPVSAERCAFYFRRSARGNVTELEQTLPVVLLPPIDGRSPKRVSLSQYDPMSVYCSPEHLAAQVRQNAAVGATSYTLGLNRAVEALRPDVAEYMAMFQRLITDHGGEVVFIPQGSHPLYGAAGSPALSRGHLYAWVRETPAAQARFFKDIAPWGVKYFHFYSMYCPSHVTDEGADMFRALVRREYEDMLSGFSKPGVIFLDWEVDPWRERVRPTETFTHARWCFCDRCKRGFRKFAGLSADADLSDDAIFRDHRDTWVRYRRQLEGRIQREMLKVARDMGMAQLLYSGDSDYYAACTGHLDRVFAGVPGNSVADSHLQNRYSPGQSIREAAGVRQIVGQRFSFSLGRSKEGWKGTYCSYDGFLNAKSWKPQVIRMTAWMHGGVDLENLMKFSGGAAYYIGEAMRLIAAFEPLFWDGERADERAEVSGLPPGNLIVLEREDERLVLLFNEATTAQTVTLTNKGLSTEHKARIVEGAEVTAPERMEIVIPPEDVVAVHIGRRS